ncbi:MAG: histidine kinase dimerization/phosphoacceptor domain -containing protein, partial [bacterium]
MVKNKNKFKNVSGWNVANEIYFDDSAENHVCIEVINQQNSNPVYIKDLEETRFCQSDPNVKKFDYSTFLGIPVRVNDETVGSFCLTTRDRSEFTEDDLEIMKMLGRAVAREEKRIASQKELSRYVDLKRELETTVEEKEILLKEVHHRVKNNMQQIISILDMQQQKIEDKETISTLQKSQTRVQTMGLIHNLLYKSENLTEISLGNYLEELTHQL